MIVELGDGWYIDPAKVAFLHTLEGGGTRIGFDGGSAVRLPYRADWVIERIVEAEARRIEQEKGSNG